MSVYHLKCAEFAGADTLKQFAINERGPYSTFQLRAWLSPPSRSDKWRTLCRLDTVDLNVARLDFTLSHHYLELTNNRLT